MVAHRYRTRFWTSFWLLLGPTFFRLLTRQKLQTCVSSSIVSTCVVIVASVFILWNRASAHGGRSTTHMNYSPSHLEGPSIDKTITTKKTWSRLVKPFWHERPIILAMDEYAVASAESWQRWVKTEMPSSDIVSYIHNGWFIEQSPYKQNGRCIEE